MSVKEESSGDCQESLFGFLSEKPSDGELIVRETRRLQQPLSNTSPAYSDEAYLEWLKERSMMLQSETLTQLFSGQGAQWRYSYGLSRPEDFLSLSSVWFTAYPSAMIGRSSDNILQTLADPELLHTLKKLGIQAVHTGPLKLAGGVVGKQQYKPSVDGYFDWIELTIDPDLGTQSQYQVMTRNADAHGIAIIGDLIPGHTGKGPDFRLAERNVTGFPGLYSMVEIQPEDWSLLPTISEGDDSINLSQEIVQALKAKGYIPGLLDAVIFGQPGIKESNWSATNAVTGVDGRDRRWVYLHIYKSGQPSLNWLDPSFAAHRLLAGDILHSLQILGIRGLRLDANMFLGIESRPGNQQDWLSGHPLSNLASQTIAMLIRKFGGYSFQEFNTDLDDLSESMKFGPELSYDFVTRPAYLYALVIGDAGLLRLMLREMLTYRVQPMRLVHALQNHDDLMLEATHLKVNADKFFEYEGVKKKGGTLFECLHLQTIAAATGKHAPYNEPCTMSPGICSTIAGLAAASIGVEDLTTISLEQVEKIRDIHLVAAAYNALQPGVFALSGWDIVGALPIPQESVRDRLTDNDYRWLNRGAYDLMGVADTTTESSAGLPRAIALYGSLPEQLENPTSFTSRLKEMLVIRQALGISHGNLVAVPQVSNPGVVLLINELYCSTREYPRLQVTAINFGRSLVEEAIRDERITCNTAQVVFSTRHGSINEEMTTDHNYTVIRLEPLEAKIIIQGEALVF